MEKKKQQAIVIAGFPGVGKTVAADHNRNWFDLESTPYHWKFDPECPGNPPEEDPEWPKNYVDAIETMVSQCQYGYQTVLVSTHQEVREELRRRGIEYVIVAPDYALKSEYMGRYLNRGSDYEFICMMDSKWVSLLASVQFDGAPVIWLKAGVTLEDILPK